MRGCGKLLQIWQKNIDRSSKEGVISGRRDLEGTVIGKT